MQINIRKNNILVKLLETEEELEKARRLRYEELILFHRDRDDISYEESYNDVDRFCDNLIAIDTDTDEVVGSYRLINKEHLEKTGGFACDATFDVTAIKNSPEKAVELGRAVVKEEYRDGIVIKCLLQGLFQYLLEYGAKYTFGIIYLPKMDEKYQAEMSQGILQSIFEYQTEIANLTGMDASNASHYDGATAIADGILMCMGAKTKAILSDALNPEYKAVVRTYLVPHGIEVVFAPTKNGVTDSDALKTLIDDEVGAVCIQQPNFFGLIEDAESVGKIAKEKGAKFVMSCYPVALALLKTPAECGADVAAGEGQPLGLPLAFGGPYLGFLTCRENLMRKLTGRIVGETVDHDGRPAYVLTLQAREQHIRREKSTSSICSNEALCALTSSIYLAAMGKEGLKDVAKQCVSKAHYMKDEIVKIDGFRLKYDGEFFNEFVIESDVDTSKIVDKLQKRGILAGLPLSDKDMLWCVTEMNTKDDIDEVVNVLREVK